MTTIEDQDLRESLELGLIDQFRLMIDRMYTYDVSWDRFDPEATGSLVLRQESEVFLTEVKQFVRKYKGHSELDNALKNLVSLIDGYEFNDIPVFDSDGRLDVLNSYVRSDFSTGDEKIDAYNHLLQVEDRETVLLIQRGRLAEDVERLMSGRGAVNHGDIRTPLAPAKVQWEGSTIEFVEIIDGLLKKGYFSMPEGNLTELVRRLLHAFEVRKSRNEVMTPEGLSNRFHGTRNEVLAAKIDALPDATRKR